MKMFVLLFLTLTLIACNSTAGNKTGGDKSLPNFSLKDPAGKTFTEDDLKKNGAVVVVTAPILSNEDAQKGWEEQLNKSKSGKKAKLVFVEDMSASSFEDKARDEMKKEYKSGEEPILLLDEEGKLRKDLGIKEKETVVLVFNDSGKLVYQQREKPSEAAAKAAWNAVEK